MPSSGPNETSCILQFKESELDELMSSDEQRNWEKRSIYKVRPCIAEHHMNAYQPQVVSFGPYHHDNDRLLPMEVHKRRALCHFVKRSGKTLERFRESLREVAQNIEESYDELDSKWKAGGSEGAASQFLDLMITDGCFMLEILRVANQEATQAKQEKDDYEVNDPIFSKHGKLHVMPYIRRDMLVLENQLPMLVLDQLVAVESGGRKGDEFINSLILKFCCPSPHKVTSCSSPPKVTGKCLHILDVYRKSLLLPEIKDRREPAKPRQGLIRSATELHGHGILFNIGTTNLKDISFEKGVLGLRGVLTLPKIWVDDTTESAYLNLIAFEHCHVGAGNEVRSYIYLMDKIIDKEGDVALLHGRGIIQNAIGSDKAVAQLFNSLCKEVTLEPLSSLDAVHTEVSEYCKFGLSAWRAKLNHILSNIYSNNSYVTLSIVAAIFLFALAIIQTVYTVLSYFK